MQKPVPELKKAARILLTLLFALAPVASASAETVSDWSASLGAKARLIAGSSANGLQAGIQIVLDDGWQTYWRNPGAGGIPPIFDWSGSRNLADAEVLFPAPMRSQYSYGTSMGYKKAVVFPVMLRIIDPGKPVFLNLNLNYGACEKICVPAQASLQLELPANISLGYSPAIQASLDRVPVTAREGDAKVEIAEIAQAADDSWIEVTARFPGQPGVYDTFVEGPADWYLPAPEPVSRLIEGETLVVKYRVDLAGVPEDSQIQGTQLLFTLVADSRAVEQIWIVE